MGDLGFGTNNAAVGRPSKERRTDEQLDDTVAGSIIES
jgi:hypothetical protein